MGHSIDISQLKNSGNSTMPEKEPNSNNTGKNIDGKKLQDFGNGLKEFDPAANGFEHVKIERLPNDKDRALAAFDKKITLEQISMVEKFQKKILEKNLIRNLLLILFKMVEVRSLKIIQMEDLILKQLLLFRIKRLLMMKLIMNIYQKNKKN